MTTKLEGNYDDEPEAKTPLALAERLYETDPGPRTARILESTVADHSDNLPCDMRHGVAIAQMVEQYAAQEREQG